MLYNHMAINLKIAYGSTSYYIEHKKNTIKLKLKTTLVLQHLPLQEMVTSTVLGLGGGGSFSTTKVRTPFSHFADIADTLAFSGNRNFLNSFWCALLSSRRYLQPSSSPSSRFLFPPLRTTRVFSSSTVTCSHIFITHYVLELWLKWTDHSLNKNDQRSIKICYVWIYQIFLVLPKMDNNFELSYLNIRLGQTRDVHIEYILLRSIQNVSWDAWKAFVLTCLLGPVRREHEFLNGLRNMEDMSQIPIEHARFCHFAHTAKPKYKNSRPIP